MPWSMGLSAIALLVSLWALFWSRRAAVAAERNAVASELSAESARRSALTAEAALDLSRQQLEAQLESDSLVRGDQLLRRPSPRAVETETPFAKSCSAKLTSPHSSSDCLS